MAFTTPCVSEARVEGLGCVVNIGLWCVGGQNELFEQTTYTLSWTALTANETVVEK